MPKFLWQVSYTSQGAQGLQKDGGTARRAAIQKLTESWAASSRHFTSRSVSRMRT